MLLHAGWEGRAIGCPGRRPAGPYHLRDFRRLFLPRLPDRFFGTFWPAALASDNPIAMACLRLFTLRPERPLFKVPDLRFFIARLTEPDAFFEYLLAMLILLWRKTNRPRWR